MTRKSTRAGAKTREIAVQLALATLLAMGSAAHASDHEAQFGMGYSVWGLGEHFDKNMLRLSYEFAPSERFWGVRPLAGIFLNTDSEYYLSLGWVKEFARDKKLSWGIGQEAGYWHGDEHLGHDLEFYSRIFADYDTSDRSFLRLEFGHISNAGFGERNPGAEIATLSFIQAF